MRAIATILLISLAGYLPAQKHVFYLHGRIVEVMGPQAVDSVNGFGAYQYSAILDSLRGRKFEVISEVRPKTTNEREYARRIAEQISGLISRGIPAKDIAVIGASKGSVIAMLASSYLKDPQVSFVLMAACSENNLARYPEISLHGRILSIYESSDGYGSCQEYKKRSAGITDYQEIKINTGLRHGFLFRPLRDWLEPASEWINAK